MTDTVGKRVRIAREGAKLSQGRLAQLVGVTQPTISELENGDGETSLLPKIARFTGYSVDWLDSGDGPPKPPGSKFRHEFETFPEALQEQLIKIGKTLGQ